MKTRTLLSLIAIPSLCFLTLAPISRAGSAAPANLADAEKRVQQQGLSDEASDYHAKFMASISDHLAAAVKDGSASKGKSSFDVLCVVAADGHITNTFLTDPSKQALGEYVAPKLIGVQAAKPPKPDWVVYLSMEHP